MRAVCGDKPHVQFGRGGLVLLSNQDLAFYLTSERRKATYLGKGQPEKSGQRIPLTKVSRGGVIELSVERGRVMRKTHTILQLLRERGKKRL